VARFTDDEGFELVDWDAATGKSVWAKREGDSITYRSDYPVDSILSLNAEQRAIAERGWRGDLHHIASVPVATAWDSGLVEAFGDADDKFMSRWLNDADNRAFRTKEGVV